MAVTRWPSWRHRDQIRLFRLSQRGSRGLARAGARCQDRRAGTLLGLPQLAGSAPAATATLMRLPGGFPKPPVSEPPARGTPEPQEGSGLGPAANTGCQPRDKHAPDIDGDESYDNLTLGTRSLTSALGQHRVSGAPEDAPLVPASESTWYPSPSPLPTEAS